MTETAKVFPPYWELRPGEHGDMIIMDLGAGVPICSLYCGPNEADSIRYLVERANEGNAAYVEKLAAEGKLETAATIPMSAGGVVGEMCTHGPHAGPSIDGLLWCSACDSEVRFLPGAVHGGWYKVRV